MGEVKNKNSLAICDERMKELRKALRVEMAGGAGLNIHTLAKATLTVNERIHHHRLSAKEVLFSRDNNTSKNLKLDDSDIAKTIADNRESKSAANRATGLLTKKEAKSAKVGKLVYLMADLTKSRAQEMYMVIAEDQTTDLVTGTKIKNLLSDKPMTMQPQRYRYRVKQTNIICSPSQPKIVENPYTQPQ